VVSACLACANTGGREIHGVVRIMETGEPAAHAIVVVDRLGRSLPLVLPPRIEVARATAAADGSFTITLPGKGEVKRMLIGVRDERCAWNATGRQLASFDLNEPLVLTVTQWNCAPK